VSRASGLVDRTAPVEHYLARIDSHLARLTSGHDPIGHLFAIERLARAARIDWWARTASRGSDRPRDLP
jgi:hypothetical protein